LLDDGQGNIISQLNNQVIIGNSFEADLKEVSDINQHSKCF